MQTIQYFKLTENNLAVISNVVKQSTDYLVHIRYYQDIADCRFAFTELSTDILYVPVADISNSNSELEFINWIKVNVPAFTNSEILEYTKIVENAN